MRGLIVALQFLTRLPMPHVDATIEDFARSIRWFPAAGLIVGLVVAGAVAIGVRIDPWIGALAGTIAWAAVTGALHLDGLADLADGIGAAHRDRARLLAVMADPHIGSFGVVAITLQLAAKLVLLHGLAKAPLLVALVPLTARIGPLVWARWLPPLHPGLAARFSESVRRRDLAGWGLVLAGMAAGAPAMPAVVPLIAGWGWWLKRRLGGVSGDCHGAGIELVEAGLLLALCATRGA